MLFASGQIYVIMSHVTREGKDEREIDDREKVRRKD